jgi:hypothetical protein
MTDSQQQSGTGTDKETRFGNRAAIVVSVIAIIGSLYTFWNWLRDNFWWLVARWWIAALAALIVAVCVWLVKRTTRGGNLWQSARKALHRLINLDALVIFLIAVNTFYLGIFIANRSHRPKSKTISGIIYYLPCNGNPGLDPAPNVRVFLPEQNFESNPTGSDGKFSISGIPTTYQIKQLTAELGGLHYPITYNEGQGSYPLIPRSCDYNPPVWDVHAPWQIGSDDNECLSEETPKIKRRYLLEALIPAEGKRQAILTVELRDTVDVTIQSAFVLSPSEQSGGYSEVMEGLNEQTARRWIFDLPANGLTFQLEVCLGSQDSSASLSERHLRTSYQLR